MALGQPAAVLFGGFEVRCGAVGVGGVLQAQGWLEIIRWVWCADVWRRHVGTSAVGECPVSADSAKCHAIRSMIFMRQPMISKFWVMHQVVTKWDDILVYTVSL